MKWRLVYFLKLLALVSLTAYLSSSGVLKAQNDSKAIEITDKDGKSTILYEESHALVIWAGNYQHWSRLNNVEVEAKQVVKALERRGFQVKVVGNPTGEDLRSAIKDFIDNYGYESDNRLVIFFTGHGHTRNRTKGYLVPVDAPDPTSRRNERDFLRVALPMQQIITWARLIEAKHVLFVFDSCFSGTVFKTKARPRPENAYIRDVIGKPVRQFIAAGDADQEVPAKSIFTPLFIRGLEGEADYTRDGYVTGSELGLYLTQTLSEYTSAQTPQYGKIRDVELDRGDIVFRSLDEQISRPLPSPTPSPEPSDTTSTRSSDSKPSLIEEQLTQPDLLARRYLMDNVPSRIIIVTPLGGNEYRLEEPSSPWPWEGTAKIDGGRLSGDAKFRNSLATMRVEGIVRDDSSIVIQYKFITGSDGNSAGGRVDNHVWYPSN